MKINNYAINSFYKKAATLLFFITIFCCLYNVASAADSLVDVVRRVESNVSAVSRLIILLAYVSGVGFAMAGILQFKAHKDNPQQVPLSKPIVLVCVGAVLLFLPKLMDTAGKSIFGGDTSATGPQGAIDISQINPDNANKIA